MLGRMLVSRGISPALLQTQAMYNTASQCSMLLAWMTQRNTGSSTLVTSPASITSTHSPTHTSVASLAMNFDGHSYLTNTPRCSPRNQREPSGVWTHSHTVSSLVLPFIATRGLTTLSTVQGKVNAQNRSQPNWSPRGVTMVGGVMVDIKGMAKDTGGFKNLQSRISSLQVKKRVQRKKKMIQEESEEEWQVTAYATAHEYDIEKLLQGLARQGLYKVTSFTTPPSPHQPQELQNDPHDLPDPSEVLHAVATYHLESEPREIYFFHTGAVVFWNVAELERNSVLKFLRKYQKGSHNEKTVEEECESLTYTYCDTPSRTKLVRDSIHLNPEGPTDLEKYTFSNALSVSVQLGIWEAALDEYIENIEYVSEELSKTGLVVLSQDQVLQRMGQLFALRHLVNLSSDLLDVPDFYWEHENLEQLYRKTSDYLSVTKRTSVMNVKLSHCVELMELLKSHLNERHSSRLEWIIIILIMVEVGFELLHFIERLL